MSGLGVLLKACMMRRIEVWEFVESPQATPSQVLGYFVGFLRESVTPKSILNGVYPSVSIVVSITKIAHASGDESIAITTARKGASSQYASLTEPRYSRLSQNGADLSN